MKGGFLAASRGLGRMGRITKPSYTIPYGSFILGHHHQKEPRQLSLSAVAAVSRIVTGD